MVEKYFKVSLKSDVVLNTKLATEGNMETLDFIPGSNFLGIVASQLYKELTPEEAYNLFHSGKVSFGDATIFDSETGEISYPIPFDFMMVKGEDKFGEHPVYLQHLLNEDNHPKENGFKKQLKQKRAGFITASGKVANKIEKTFAIKSAQDAITRRSAEGKMYGFESIKKGQVFIFSVQAEKVEDLNKIERVLNGDYYIGKSKSAQYGHVKIEPLQIQPQPVETFSPKGNYTLVYAQSHLCFFDEFGNPQLQPSAEELGFENGTVNWEKSSVRTFAYSPWNGKRNTTDGTRICIAAGSVFYIEGTNEDGSKRIGAYQAEGLGRVLINPAFLQGTEDASCNFIKIVENTKDKSPKERNDVQELNVATKLGAILKAKAIVQQNEFALSKAIQDQLNSQKDKFNKYKISASQWGAIRTYATKAGTMAQLEESLISDTKGYLKHGVAYDRYWNKNGGKPLNEFMDLCMKAKQHKGYETIFIAKFAAQMAKVAPKS